MSLYVAITLNKVGYHKQSARQHLSRKILTRLGRPCENFLLIQFDHRAKFGLCYRVSVCRYSQKFWAAGAALS